MTTSTAAAQAAPKTDPNWLRIVQISIPVAVVGLVVLAIGGTLLTTSSGGHFKYTADYWYTASGLPIAIGGIGTVLGVHRLQRGADGRLGSVGAWICVVALVELFVQLLASLLTSTEQQWGPMYILSTGLTFVGHALFVSGSWRTGVLPRWLLGVWPLAWIIGSFAAGGALPLVLVAFYVVLGVVLTRRQRA